MQRIAEPELMDDAAQAAAYAAADFAEPHNAFVAAFRARFPTFVAGRVADLGCGPADVSLRFAHALPQVRLLGVDGAAAMLALARQASVAAGLAERVEFLQAYLPAPLPGLFDAVISNSLLHHLADPATLWQTILAVARPGAPILVMDLLRPESPAQAAALVARHAAAAPPVLAQDFYHSLLAAWRPDEVREQIAAAGLEQLQVAVTSDRHWIAWGTR